jgi:hypothetical protein
VIPPHSCVTMISKPPEWCRRYHTAHILRGGITRRYPPSKTCWVRTRCHSLLFFPLELYQRKEGRKQRFPSWTVPISTRLYTCTSCKDKIKHAPQASQNKAASLNTLQVSNPHLETPPPTFSRTIRTYVNRKVKNPLLQLQNRAKRAR